MTEQKYKEALVILRKIDQEERNWRVARSQLGELLDHGIEAQRTLTALQDQEAGLRKSIDRLKGAQAVLENTAADLKSQVAGFENELKQQEKTKVDHLDSLDQLIGAKEKRVDEVEHEFEGIRGRLGLK